jgi:glycosyl hydrolase family 26
VPLRKRPRAALLLVAIVGLGVAGCGKSITPDTGHVFEPGAPAAPLGVYDGSAATQDVAAFSKRLGRPVDLVHDYLGKRRWSSIEDVYHLADNWRRAGFEGRTVLTVPIIPDSGGSLAQGAAGRYNRYFRELAKRLVAGGQDMAILRLGHEFNGTWYKWTINVPHGGRLFAAYWRQIVVTMRSVRGARFRFDWCPVAGSSYIGGKRQLSAQSAYPGDRYVDYIGMDVFDQSWAPRTASAAARWRHLVLQRDGLAWHARFADAHRKPMTFPEWGLVHRDDNRGGGDAPYFIEHMHAWIQSHPVAYSLYFESRDPSGDYRIFGGRFPHAARTFVQLFGVPRAARPRQTLALAGPTG